MNPLTAISAAIPTGSRHRAAAAKHAASRVAKRMVGSAGRGLNRLMGSRANGRFGILMYHRITDPWPGVVPPTCNVTPAALRAQLVGLLDRGFQAWPLSRVIEDSCRGFTLPEGTFVVTYDDGHESVYRNAWPILLELKIPATLFLPTAYLDGRQAFPFDDWSAAGSPVVPSDKWRPMSTVQCRDIAADGLVELGAHTHTHQDFCGRPEDFDHDLAINVENLRSRFAVRNPSFAFPWGRATSKMMNLVRQAGLSCALMCSDTLVDPRDTPFGWRRFNVESWDTAATLAAKLEGWYSLVPTMRRRLMAWSRPEHLYEQVLQP
jgi:peptidoglycan/xylan/chitin deacetylase (PgdA/CDA1 family)